MTLRIRTTIVIAFILCSALPVWSRQYLYTPQPVAADQKPAAQDGILVEEIEIKKGDTLHDLSRKYSGRGSYFPQILLFNTIKNPDLIHEGANLRVPVAKSGAPAPAAKAADAPLKKKAASVSKSSAEAGTKLYLSDLKTGAPTTAKSDRKKKTVLQAANQAPAKEAVLPVTEVTSGQKLFESAVKAYRTDDFSTALGLFNRFLAENAKSPLAADATLYKAECYLKLSAK